MATKLKNLIITKVALVNEGACSAAHIKLYKQKEGGNGIMNYEEILKSLTEEQQAIVTAEFEKAKGEIPEGFLSPEDAKKLADEKATADAAVAKSEVEKTAAIEELTALKKSKEDNATEEEILKGLAPEVRAILEKSKNQQIAAETAILKMKDEADDVEALAKAKELPNIGAETEALAKSFKSLKKADESLFEEVFGIMKAANEMINANGALGEVGNNGDSETLAKAADVAWNKIEKAAEEIKKAVNCTKEQSIATAIKENGKLYAEYLANLK